jgi:hypothetical protein
VRGPHIRCNGLGLERTRCLFEELDQPSILQSVLVGRCATAYWTRAVLQSRLEGQSFPQSKQLCRLSSISMGPEFHQYGSGPVHPASTFRQPGVGYRQSWIGTLRFLVGLVCRD